MKKRYTIMTIMVFLLIGIDQLIKSFIVGDKGMSISNGSIGYIQNFGGAFGIGENSTALFILINIVVLGIIIKFIYSQKDRIDNEILTSFTLILSGGFSNLIDRVVRGCVVDYIDVTKYIKFPIFNIADIFVVVGCIMLFVFIIIYWYKEIKEKPKEENF